MPSKKKPAMRKHWRVFVLAPTGDVQVKEISEHIVMKRTLEDFDKYGVYYICYVTEEIDGKMDTYMLDSNYVNEVKKAIEAGKLVIHDLG